MNPVVALIRNFALGTNAAALSLLHRPRAMAQYLAESLFVYRKHCGRGLPPRNVWEEFPAVEQYVHLVALDGDTWFHTSASYGTDLISLCLLARALRPQTIFEIGTLGGYTAFHLAANSDAEVYTLDLPPNTPAGLGTTFMDRRHIEMHNAHKRMAWDGSSESHRIHPLFGDSGSFDFSPWHGKVDLFFIDGAHSYQYVRNDTLRAMECCHAGSVIAWHDYGRFGVNDVTKWLHEFTKSHSVFCVPGGSLAFHRLSYSASG